MSPILSLSFKLSPFPYAAVAIAANTGAASVSYDESLTGLSLALGETSLTVEDDIVQALAESGGLVDDRAKVRQMYLSLDHADNQCRRLSRSLLSPLLCAASLLFLRSSQHLTQSTINWHSVRSSLATSPPLQIGWSGVP